MSVLRNLESKLAGLVEGTFGRVFRTEVRPEELARRLAREMDEHRTVSLSRTYAPHEYVVHLSPQDRENLAPVEPQVAEELSGYLLEHARAERVALVATPVIAFRTDERLGLGEFGIETRLVQVQEEAPPAPAPRAPAPPPVPPKHETMVTSGAARAREQRDEAQAARRSRAILAAEGKRFAIGPAGAVIGRSRECDVVLADSNVSRRHARIAFDEDGAWTVEDLGSTNGVQVNGARVPASAPTPLRSGDRLDIGTVSARFEVD